MVHTLFNNTVVATGITVLNETEWW